MLDKVRGLVNRPLLSFQQFFTLYCMEVQDSNIEQEAISKLRNLNIDTRSLIDLEKSMNSEQGKLVTK